jgi:predicted HAD superfamily Cof-like phosphohydrolase
MTKVVRIPEPEALNSVAEFHMLFQHPIMDVPGIPSVERCELRYNLLHEEVRELSEAIDNNDIVAVADALADIQYVLSGAVLEFGLKDKFKALFDEVQRSNMSKACKTEDEARATIAKVEIDQPGKKFQIVERFGLFFVYREDMKTIKSINYSPADLESIVNS